MTKIALVHEWLSSAAGSEQTFERMAAVLPSADLFALTTNDGYLTMSTIHPDRVVATSLLQRCSKLRERRELTLPVMPLAWRLQRGRSNYDVVVTSSHAFARWFPRPGSVHLSYVYTPLRFAWTPEIDGRGAGRALAPARAALRRLDRATVASVDEFACISETVRDRVRRFYDRDARVVYPPVNVDHLLEQPRKADGPPFVLGFSRWVGYKRLDLTILAAHRAGLPAVIAGSGPEETRLRGLAEAIGANVRFERAPSNERIAELMSSAAVLVFMADEDFGIVPVEAQAAGLPVVCLDRGGASETVIDGVTGIHVSSTDPSDVADAVRRAMQLQTTRTAFTASATRFSAATFDHEFTAWVGPYTGTPEICRA